MPTLNEEYISRINRVIDYIDLNLGANLTLAELAEVACFSKDHFNRIFSAIVGETLYDYIQRLRVEYAANKLCQSDDITITDLAFEFGFDSISGFSRAFKKYFDVSPTQWKENQKNNNRVFGQTESGFGKQKFEDLSYFRNVNLSFNNKRIREMKNELNATVEVKQMEEFTVAYVRHIGPYKGDSALFEGLVGRLCQWAGPRGLIAPNKMKMICVYHDNPEITDEDKLRLSVCMQVPNTTAVEGEIGKMLISGGQYAIASYEIHAKDYQKAWDFVYGEWMAQSGYQPADGPCYEHMKMDPRQHPEGKHLVDIYVPVKPM